MDTKKEKFIRFAICFLVISLVIGSLAYHAIESHRHSGEKFSVKISDIPISKPTSFKKLPLTQTNGDLKISPEQFVSFLPSKVEMLIQKTSESKKELKPSKDIPKNEAIENEVEEITESPDESFPENLDNSEVVSESVEDDELQGNIENLNTLSENVENVENSDASNTTDEDCENVENLDSSNTLDEDGESNYDEYCSSITYSDWDLFMFEATMYSECGAQSTSRDVIVANCWIARNKIEQEIEQGSSDPFRAALNANHYQGVYDDPYYGWRAISREEGVITQELINSNPSIHEICSGVLSGEIESPIYNYDCCLCCKSYVFDVVVATAESLGLSNFIVVENGFFFHHSDWTEMCNQYCANF